MPWLLSQPPDSLQIPWAPVSQTRTSRYLQDIKFSAGLWNQESGKKSQTPIGKKILIVKKALAKINPNFCLGKYWFERLQACTLRPLKGKSFSKRWLSAAQEGVPQERDFYTSFQQQVPKISDGRDLQKFPNSSRATGCSAPSRHNCLLVYIRTPNPRHLFLQITDFLFTNRAANSFPPFWYSTFVSSIFRRPGVTFKLSTYYPRC